MATTDEIKTSVPTDAPTGDAEPITETGNVEYVKNADGDWEMEESSYDMLSSVFGG